MTHGAMFGFTEVPAFGNICSLREKNIKTAEPARFRLVHEGVNSSEVRSLLALRAGVLRRAASQAGTAQERRAEINAIAASPGSRGASPKTKSSVATSVRSTNSPKSASGIIPNPQEDHLLFAGLARPMVHARHSGSFTLTSAG